MSLLRGDDLLKYSTKVNFFFVNLAKTRNLKREFDKPNKIQEVPYKKPKKNSLRNQPVKNGCEEEK